jgi:hypothetical protein
MPRRRVLPLVLITVATVIAFLAMFALWANRQLLDTENWTDTSTQLLEDEDIREQISIALVDALYEDVDVEASLEAALPPRAAPLAGPAAGGLKTLSQRAARELLERPRPQALWEEANRRAHTRFLQVVEGGGDVVSTDEGDVTLDLTALLGEAEERAGVGGGAQERIPEDSSQITILEADNLELAQDLVDFLQAIAWVLVGLMLGLYALAVYLARGWRREALRAVGVGLAFAGAVVLVARSFAGDALVDSLAKTASVEPAVAATWDIGTSLLHEVASATLAYGVVLVAAAWIVGPTRFATANRRAMAPYLREPRYAYGALAIVVLIVLGWGPTPATRTVLGGLLIVALLAGGLEVLRRQTAREFPDASIEEANERMRERLSRIFGGGRAEDGKLSQLEQLGRLRDSGVLDASEFEREKARILGQAPAGAV